MENILKINDRIILTITSYASEGMGVGRIDGLAVFVRGALVGEKVSATITKLAKTYAQAELNAVIEPSKYRTEPICPAFENCGGCNLMHMTYAHQLEFKRVRVQDALKRIGGLDAKVMPCISMDEPFRYRNKAVFSFAFKNGRVVSGCIAENSHEVVPIDNCLLQSEVSGRILRAVTEWANENRITVYNRKTRKGFLRHLVTRTTAEGGTMVVIVASSDIRENEALIAAVKKADKSVKSIVLNINNDPSSLIMGRKNRLLFGSETIGETLLGFDFSVSAQSFLQVNHTQTEKLYLAAVNALGVLDTDDVVDLYCGIGTISLLLAKSAHSVTGIEIVAPAIEDARRNAARNGIENAEFICAPAEVALQKLVKDGKRISKLMLDPPRSGTMKPALDAIINSKVERIVYVSCNPATLARDCKILAQEGGYKLVSVQPVDMFPQTAHVETVVLMTRTDAGKG